MPYFLYRVSPDRSLTYLDSFDQYREARSAARSLRKSQAAVDDDMIKMVFAEQATEAETLLTRPRERIPSEDD
ncbi:MAG: hypothetical protein OES09_06980 [Gammaproteobacteria bacterium]|nr:hypothetical protein [Gammaproteobacteria bacterium]